MNDSQTTKMTVYIKRELHREVKVHAAKTGQTISAITEEALRRYLVSLEEPKC